MTTLKSFFLFAIVALATISCSKENTVMPENDINEDLAALMIGTYTGYFVVDSKDILEGEGHEFVVEKVSNNVVRFVSENMPTVEVEIMKHPSITGRLDSPNNLKENPPFTFYFEANNDDFLIYSTGDDDILFYGNRVK